MSKMWEIRKNLETCGMLLIGEKEVNWLIEQASKTQELQKQVDYWKVNYNIKEQVALKQSEEIEKLHSIGKTDDKTELEKQVEYLNAELARFEKYWAIAENQYNELEKQNKRLSLLLDTWKTQADLHFAEINRLSGENGRLNQALKEIEGDSRCSDPICERWLIARKALNKEEKETSAPKRSNWKQDFLKAVFKEDE